MVGSHSEDISAVGQGAEVIGHLRGFIFTHPHLGARDPSVHYIHRRIAHEPCGTHALGTPVELGGRSLLEDPALVDDNGVTAEGERFLRFGGGVDDDGVRVREQLPELDSKFLAELEVQIDQRLVQKQEICILHQCPGQCDPLLLAAGELGRESIEKILEVHHPRHLAGPAVRSHRASTPATSKGEAMFLKTVKLG